MAADSAYLDYNGSSPLDPRVGKAMWPVLAEWAAMPHLRIGSVGGKRLRSRTHALTSRRSSEAGRRTSFSRPEPLKPTISL